MMSKEKENTEKENPNNLQTEEAKSTRPGDIERDLVKEYQEIIEKKPKNVEGEKDEGAADNEPFDAKNNNIHQKR
jgi:hypothetical protein